MSVRVIVRLAAGRPQNAYDKNSRKSEDDEQCQCISPCLKMLGTE
jgi:hypothetical protein